MNALTVDVEEYYQTNGLNLPIDTWNSYESRVEESTRRLLDCFDKHQVRATFFIVGAVAREHPGLIRDIAGKGHEIGSHSVWHRILSAMDADGFRDDVRTSKQLLEDISGQSVTQYRAPSWSINTERYGWLRILEEEGYRIDSSIQPFKTHLSGISDAPVGAFRPVLKGRPLSLIEFPSTVSEWGALRIPFSGGFYLRAWPRLAAAYMLRRVNRSRAGMLYIHPWELDPGQPRISASPIMRLVQYYRLSSTEQKLDWMLSRFRFQPLGQLVADLSHSMRIPNLQLT